MSNADVGLAVSLQLDGGWASQFEKEEFKAHIRDRLNHSIGFRGRIMRLALLTEEARGKFLIQAGCRSTRRFIQPIEN